MTQLFKEDGSCLPVTVLQAGPCKVLQVKVTDIAELPEEHRQASSSQGKKTGKQTRQRRKDGYYAVQLGFDDKPEKSATKPEIGHARKADSGPKRFVREIRCKELPGCKQGDEITLAILDGAKRIDVTGTTKGRGWTGTIKRWNFQRQRMTHGNSKAHRRPGGLGRTNSINKGVPKGKKMAGRYGGELVTTQNLEVVKVDAERNLIFVLGAVPGHRSGYIVVQRSVKVARS